MLELEKVFQNQDKLMIRNFIKELENTLKDVGEKLEIPIEHRFSNGVYAREMKLPTGALIVGKIHKHQNMNILSEGEVSVFSEQSGMQRFKAPHSFVAAPGAKRIIYAHTPVTWTTIHATKSQDLEVIEDEVIARDYSEVIALPEIDNDINLIKGDQKCLG